MEALRLEDLLPFLNGRSDWTLRCKNGKYSLRFGRKKFKFKGVTGAASRGRRGGAAKIATATAADDFMRAKWLREIGAAGLRKMQNIIGYICFCSFMFMQPSRNLVAQPVTVDTPRDSTCGGDDEGGGEGEEDEEDTLNEDDQGGGLQRDGAAASCDSLLWDDYGVKPQVENPTLEEQDMLGTSGLFESGWPNP